ncbi:MAG TPA: dienelactone hydrolase family protein [Thermodesulfobacteriota bacterium]|jgi:dienelactone hydrolase|nr:dienelactone hydrolase family protein [Thermodesulfobacteriota bacterium]
MKKWLILLIVTVFWAVNAQATIRTDVIDYKHGDTILEGYLAYDDAIQGKRPGVIVVHEWWGINNYVRMRTEQLAKLGYIAFAIDMYGKGVRAKDAKEAGSLSSTYRSDRALMRSRANSGLEVLKNHSLTDVNRIAAIGYCFGGTTVLEMARSGAQLVGVVSFHGGLGAPNPGDAKNIKGKVLVLHGADDPAVPPDQVMAFQDEMRKAGVDWYFVSYGGAVHSFTNPDSGKDPSKGAAYNGKADKRSWEAMKGFFAEIFG